MAKTREKASPRVFEVIFKGPGIYPEKISVPFLARTLSAVRRLATGTELADEDGDDTPPDEGPLGLVKVKRSASAVYQFAAISPECAIARFTETGKVIQNPNEIGDWKMAKFKINSVWQPKIGSASEAREALRNAGGKAWDDIDNPEAFIKEMSGQ